MTEMGVDNLRNDLTNPQRLYLWEFQCMNPIGGGKGQTLLLRCQTAEIPGQSFGKIHIPFKQSGGIEVPGKINYDHALETTMIEGEDAAIHGIIYAWMQKIVHNKTNIGVGDPLIKTDLYLKLLSTKGNETMRFRFLGGWPEARAKIPVSYDDEGNILYPITWSYDRWEEA
jgi:hypothetical protein